MGELEDIFSLDQTAPLGGQLPNARLRVGVAHNGLVRFLICEEPGGRVLAYVDLPAKVADAIADGIHSHTRRATKP